MHNQNSVKKKGMTLVEVVGGIFLLVGIVATILGLTTVSMKLSRQSEATNIATWVAKQEIQKLKSDSAFTRPEATDVAFDIPNTISDQFPGATGLRLSGTYSIKNVAGSNTLQCITVKVNWKNAAGSSYGSGKETSIFLSSMVACRYDFAGSNPTEIIDDIFIPIPDEDPGDGGAGSSSGASGGTSTGGSTDSGATTGDSTGDTTGGTTGASDPPDTTGGGGETTTEDSSGGTGGSDSGSTGGSTGGDTTGGTDGGGGGIDIGYGGMWT